MKIKDIPTKDILTISISAVALVLSLAATVVSVVQGRYETQRSLRNQLSDALSRIMSATVENAKLFHDLAARDPVYFQTISTALNQEQGFLLRQAMYLTDQLPPSLVTEVEYNTLAFSNVNAGDLVSVEKYYRKAVEAAVNEYYKSTATRSYAVFLFSERRLEEGREQFAKALSLLKGSDNYARSARGTTYQFWAVSEMNYANAPKRAEGLFESATNEFNGIDNEAARQGALRGLDAMRHYRPGASLPH